MTARRWVENSLLLAGLLAVDVWIWSHAGAVIYQSWENRAFEREVQEQTAKEPDRAGESPGSPPPGKSAGPLGRLTIPRLRLRAIVREGDGEDTLSLALGHIPNTAFPGEIGNVGVAGHRDTIFRSLREIHKNDLIVFETRAGRYAYRVEATEIVNPEKVSVLKAGRTRELTLVTCYPFRYVGAAPDRFIVKARQVVQKVDSHRPARSRKAGRVLRRA
jgi:sortase A